MTIVLTEYLHKLNIKLYRYYTMSSNISTGLTVAAGMIGSLTLVLPDLFYTEGIIGCLIGMVVKKLFRYLWV
jgi:hypothetical protein